MENFAFAIPVAGFRNDAQWRALDRLLEETVRSVLNQSDSRFNVFVAGHEQPPSLSRLNDPRVQFLEVPFAKPVEPEHMRLDKTRKRWFIATKYREMGAGYFMYLDADDYVHRDLVSYVRSDNNKVGYLIEQGYVLDYQNRTIAELPGAWGTSFDRICGSSGIVYYDPDDLPERPFPDKGQKSRPYFLIKNHLHFRRIEWKGAKLTPVPFRAAIYALNNSNNTSNILIRTPEKQRELVQSIRRSSAASGLLTADKSELEKAFGISLTPPGRFERLRRSVSSLFQSIQPRRPDAFAPLGKVIQARATKKRRRKSRSES